MDGLSIVTTEGRPVLAAQSLSPLTTSLAIQTALASNAPISWVPALSATAGTEDDDDAEDDDDDVGWQEKGGAAAKARGGFAVVQIERNGLRFIAPVSRDLDPLMPLSFLTQLYTILESYIGGPVSEVSLKDHFPTILPLLCEMYSPSSGLPLLSSYSQLRDLVPPGGGSFIANAVGAAGLGPVNQASAANQLLASPLPWRRQGIKHSSNEIYFDQTETLSFLISVPSASSSSSRSTILTPTLTGSIMVRSKLSGMPDLNVTFADPTLLEDVAFHPCVRFGRWRKEHVVSFIPPDSTFPLLTYSHTSSHPHHLLPLTFHPTITSGAVGGAFSLSLSSNTTTLLESITVRLPLPEGANKLSVGGKARLEGNWLHGASGPKPAPTSLTLSFNSPNASFSPIRIQSAKLAPGPQSGEYTIYKGVKNSGVGNVEYRVA
ncbi:AP-3 complex subunit mu-1 [Pseudohyphozyma bogoriensis]|nr:AP-3 complex subunit mu-1 [Pseudohyphozyma bogoriensis]